MKITDYDFGQIAIEGKRYHSDVIILPGRVRDAWRRQEGHRLQVEDLAEVMETKPDVLIVGTGYYGRMQVPQETRAYLESQGIELQEAKTSEAVALFNRLQREITAIAAALHLTC